LRSFFVVGVMLAFNASKLMAQENVDDKFSFGKIVTVSGEEIKVKEYDFAKDADVEMTYTVTAETELGNINAVTDLVANDDVVIDYAEKDGKRVVMTLVKEDKGAEAPLDAATAGLPGASLPMNGELPVVPTPNTVSDAPVQK